MKHALIVAAILAVSLTACGKKEEAAPPAPPTAAEPAPAPEQAASAPAEAPAAEGEQKPQ
jgi:hypothetical protein